MSEYVVSWEQFHHDTRLLARKLLQRKPPRFTSIIAITKGGLIPATIIARELGLRTVGAIGVQSYGQGDLASEKRKREPSVTEFLPNILAGHPLVIDDLVDSGDTIRAVRERIYYIGGAYPQVTYAAVYAKPAGLGQLNVHAAMVPQDTWILLPWDMALKFSEPLVNQ